jgi:hypothetical protein
MDIKNIPNPDEEGQSMKYPTPKLFYEEAILSTIPVPADLAALVERTKKVRRYEDSRYPEGMIEDTLYQHLCRFSQGYNKLRN